MPGLAPIREMAYCLPNKCKYEENINHSSSSHFSEHKRTNSAPATPLKSEGIGLKSMNTPLKLCYHQGGKLKTKESKQKSKE